MLNNDYAKNQQPEPRKLTEQERAWSGEFGDAWTARSSNPNFISNNIALFSKCLDRLPARLTSIMEYGANVGQNMIALRALFPEARFHAVEINEKAYSTLRDLNYVTAYNESLIDFQPKETYDLVLSKGVLMLQLPDFLPTVYQKFYQSSKKYILICEYYNPVPVQLNHRGNVALIFKRDFAGEMLDAYPDLSLLDYGFVYHRDPFWQDDLNWFLLEKR